MAEGNLHLDWAFRCEGQLAGRAGVAVWWGRGIVVVGVFEWIVHGAEVGVVICEGVGSGRQLWVPEGGERGKDLANWKGVVATR